METINIHLRESRAFSTTHSPLDEFQLDFPVMSCYETGMIEGRKLTLLVDRELVKQAKTLVVNISLITENALTEFIRTHTYTHVRSPNSQPVQPETESARNEPNPLNAVDNEVSRRVGRNPPSVLGDIHLIGIPAPRAKFTGAYYPFHSVGWHFTLTVSLLNASASLSTADGGFFLRLYPTSRPTPRSATRSPCGWSFLKPST